ncbi:MAG: helix-turn-helix transcriptional regulator [Polyangiaceae bacterium]
MPEEPDSGEVEVDGVRYRYLAVPGTATPKRPEQLTDAEWAVAEALARGASNEQIADERGVRYRTVANQLQAIYRKLGVQSRHELLSLLERER